MVLVVALRPLLEPNQTNIATVENMVTAFTQYLGLDFYPSCKHQNEQMRGQNDVYPSYKHQNEQTVGPK